MLLTQQPLKGAGLARAAALANLQIHKICLSDDDKGSYQMEMCGIAGQSTCGRARATSHGDARHAWLARVQRLGF